jgi:hypothetical protein
LFAAFYGGNSHKQIDKYKEIAKRVGLFRKSAGYRIGKRSTEYTLSVDNITRDGPHASQDNDKSM